MRKKLFAGVAVALTVGALLPFATFAEDQASTANPPDPKEQAASVREELLERMRTELNLEQLSKEVTTNLVKQLVEFVLDDPKRPATPTARGTSPR